MSLDERMRVGLEGLDALEGAPADRLVDAVLRRGRRARWGRRLTAGALALAAALAAIVITPKALDALRSVGERRPAVPGGGLGIITTIAGTGEPGLSGDGGPATSADVNYPVDLALDGEGNLYILELGNGRLGYNVRVRKVDAAGRITTVAGIGAAGEAGRLVLGTTYGTTGLAVDLEGNVYLGGGDGPDIDNRVIRVAPSGRVTTVAGTGDPGVSGDGGPATRAELQNVWDVAVDLEGSVYIAAGSRIRRVDPRGVITTIAGTRFGFSAGGFRRADRRVTGVTVDQFGDVFFIDYSNGRIRKIDAEGTISTVAGPGRPEGDECFFGEDVPATQAIFCGPEHLDVDAFGNVYVADTFNNRIRMIDANGMIRTIAGSGSDGYSGDGGPALEASLSKPSGVAVGPDGAIYVADSENDRVRQVVS
jgi:hypothetical protein